MGESTNVEANVIPIELAGQLLETLPIAAAIGRVKSGRVQFVAHNRCFERLGLCPGGRARIDANVLMRLAREALDSAGEQFQAIWESGDPVNKQKLDITAVERMLGPRDNTEILFTFIDRTCEAEAQESLRREMVSDSLTGLLNRTGFEEAVEARIDESTSGGRSRTRPYRYAILIVDMARFSQINECAGGVVGDELISTVARRLMSKIRKVDILARIGGDEFAIFAELTNGDKDVWRVADRIESAFHDTYRLSDMEIQIEAAIGAAIGGANDRSPGDHIRDAHIALKKAKQSKQVEIYTPEALDIARRRFTLETELRKALQKNGLKLYYQPLVDFSNGQIVGFEALARWNDSDRGPISPAEFVPVAEESGLIVPLGRWALQEACETLKEWDLRAGASLPLKVNVNVSAVQFARDDLPRIVSQALKSSKLEPERLTLELTESVVVSDPERAASVMHALRKLDVSLAMDDFGTGYSNLAYLQQLPIDVLKIDRSFVSRMLEEKDKVAIVRAVLSLATALGMETTAEGIESLELYNMLAALGCTYGQGYYLAAPLAADEAFETYLNQCGTGFSAVA
ncbi:MAG: bifunctional diguanylate cyclase/phosphodiesterase [Blastomonas sp.]